jgi:hypothetical protein
VTKPKGKTEVNLKSLARGFTEIGVSTLGAYINSPAISPEVKVQAIKIMFDRGWGRPAQSIEHTGKDGAEEIRVTLRTIVEGKK